MRKYYPICLLLALVPFATANSDEKTNIEKTGIQAITDSITSICDKPGEAGRYWEAKVKGDTTGVKLLNLVDIGFTGEVDFSEGEWNGVQRTIEDAKDYRACARELTPLFIEKFEPVIEQEQQEQRESSNRILGGIKYQQFGAGVAITLESCEKKTSAVTCHLTARAENSDVGFDIYRKLDGATTDMSDQGGHRFYANHAKVANFENELIEYPYRVSAALIKGVDTDISIRFDNVRPEAVSISRLRIRALISNGSEKRHSFYFRDIKMEIQSSK